MFRVLFWKELREIWWLGLFPLAMMLYAAAVETEFGPTPGFGFGFRHVTRPDLNHTVPLAGAEMPYAVLLWGGLLAAILGLWQTFRESHLRTWHFLLHRPVNRSLVLRAKMASAGLVFAVAVILPVMAVCLWAATPGTHASPFHWSMTHSVWFAAATGTVLYLASLYAGLRRGHLLGTRWWPLLGVTAWFVIGGIAFMEVANTDGQLVEWGVLLLLNVLLIAAVRDELRLADFN